MKDHEKKEFIRDIMNFGESFDDKTHKEFYSSSVKDFKTQVLKDLTELNIPVENLEYDQEKFFDHCKETNTDPMEWMDWAFDMIASAGDFQVKGQAIDLSKSNEILAEMKEKFKQYKKSEDINNL